MPAPGRRHRHLRGQRHRRRRQQRQRRPPRPRSRTPSTRPSSRTWTPPATAVPPQRQPDQRRPTLSGTAEAEAQRGRPALTALDPGRATTADGSGGRDHRRQLRWPTARTPDRQGHRRRRQHGQRPPWPPSTTPSTRPVAAHRTWTPPATRVLQHRQPDQRHDPTFSGTAEADSTVELLPTRTQVGSATANGSATGPHQPDPRRAATTSRPPRPPTRPATRRQSTPSETALMTPSTRPRPDRLGRPDLRGQRHQRRRLRHGRGRRHRRGHPDRRRHHPDPDHHRRRVR